jgi:hypothetical protein
MESQHVTPSSGAPPAPKILADILRQALTDSAGTDDLTKKNPFLLAARTVAARHPNQAFCADPILTELVLELIVTYYRIAPQNRAPWKPIAATVAASLFDDPAAKERLEHLWRRLCDPSA